MGSLTLQQVAERLGLRRLQLVKKMRAAGLLDHRNFPARPDIDGAHLFIHHGLYSHPSLGERPTYTTRLKVDSLRWLAKRIGAELPMPEAQPDRRVAGDA